MARETLLFLPGMLCDARLFGPQLEAFAPQYDVVVGALDSASTISEIATAVLDAVPNGPLNIAGLSLGGIVAMEIAKLAPQRLQRLALIDTNHLADTAERVAIRNTQITKVRSGCLYDVLVEEMKPNYLAQQHRSDEDLLNLLIDMAMKLGSEVFLRQSLALRDRVDQSDGLRSIVVPTLILCGEEDALCPPARHEAMAKLIEGAELVSIPCAGHITTLENPKAVNEALAQWLKCPV
ncbi:MAG: alpha/beta fold hydrolase [Hyphomicrobiales bacterium]